MACLGAPFFCSESVRVLKAEDVDIAVVAAFDYAGRAGASQPGDFGCLRCSVYASVTHKNMRVAGIQGAVLGQFVIGPQRQSGTVAVRDAWCQPIAGYGRFIVGKAGAQFQLIVVAVAGADGITHGVLPVFGLHVRRAA